MESNHSCFYLIKSDLARFANPSFKNFVRFYFLPTTPFKYQVWLRIWMAVRKKLFLKIFFGIYSFLRFHHLSHKYGITINTDMTIGRGLKIVHSYGVHINAKRIGDNFTIYQNSTIGFNRGGVPIIGNDIIVYANSLVIGDISLGDGCIVSSMTLVNKSASCGTHLKGIPACAQEVKE